MLNGGQIGAFNLTGLPFIGSAKVLDPFFNSVIFGSHFETLTDVKGHALSGSASISTDDKYFSNSSLFFDGNAASYLAIDDPINDFSITANGDFTYDTFLNFNSLGSNANFLPFLEIGAIGSGGFRIGWYNDAGAGLIQMYIGGSPYYFTWLPTINTWYYFALERNNNVITCKINSSLLNIDGSLINTSFSISSAIVSTSASWLGGSRASVQQRMRGYFDDSRFTKVYRNVSEVPLVEFPNS